MVEGKGERTIMLQAVGPGGDTRLWDPDSSSTPTVLKMYGPEQDAILSLSTPNAMRTRELLLRCHERRVLDIESPKPCVLPCIVAEDLSHCKETIHFVLVSVYSIQAHRPALEANPGTNKYRLPRCACGLGGPAWNAAAASEVHPAPIPCRLGTTEVLTGTGPVICLLQPPSLFCPRPSSPSSWEVGIQLQPGLTV